jgi:4-amino-4-deoxy-L-arabinose transferase-like glycosyltransferase
MTGQHDQAMGTMDTQRHGPSTRRAAVIFALALASYFAWTFGHELWNPDETREGGILWAMVADQNYAVPHLNGRPFLEKPPLYYWTGVALARVAGRLTPGIARLPAVLYGLLGAAVAAWIGAKLLGLRAGLLGGAVLALTPKYAMTAHFALTDLPLTFFVYLAYLAFIGQEPERTGGVGSRTAYRGLFALAAAGAFLSKGLIGPVLIGAGLGAYLVWRRRPGQIMILAALGAAGVALAAGPWLYALWRQGGDESLRVFVIDNHVGRFAKASLGHREWFGYYLYIFPLALLPWTIPLVPAAVMAWRRRSEPALRLLFCWVLAGLVILSLSSSKREIYLLPVLAPAAVMIGAWLNEDAWALRRERQVLILLALGVAGTVGSSLVLERPLDAERSFKPLFDRVAAEVPLGATLYGLHLSEMEEGAANFYLGRTFPAGDDAQALAAYRRDHPGTVYVLLDEKAYRKDRERLAGFTEVFSHPVGKRKPHVFVLLQSPAE